MRKRIAHWYFRGVIFTLALFSIATTFYLLALPQTMTSNYYAIAIKILAAMATAVVLLGIVLESVTRLFFGLHVLHCRTGRLKKLIAYVERLGAWILVLGVACELPLNVIEPTDLPTVFPTGISSRIVIVWILFCAFAVWRVHRGMHRTLRE